MNSKDSKMLLIVVVVVISAVTAVTAVNLLNEARTSHTVNEGYITEIERAMDSQARQLTEQKVQLEALQAQAKRLDAEAGSALRYWQGQTYCLRSRLRLWWEQPGDSANVTQWTPLASGAPEAFTDPVVDTNEVLARVSPDGTLEPIPSP